MELWKSNSVITLKKLLKWKVLLVKTSYRFLKVDLIIQFLDLVLEDLELNQDN